MKKNRTTIWKIIAAAMLLASCAQAAPCPVGGCGSGGGDWEKSAQAFLNSDVPLVGLAAAGNVQTSSFRAGEPATETQNATESGPLPTDYIKPQDRTVLFLRPKNLQPLTSIPGSYVVVDVSNQQSNGAADIRDAIHVPWKSFLYENGTLQPVPEIAGILAESGINRDDRAVVYSDTFRSGEAAFVIWLLHYLGQENVLALDGGLDDWTAASLPLETEQSLRASANYTPQLRTELLADYGYVKSGAAQMVDARSFQEFGKSRIPGAFFTSPEDVLGGGLLKPGAQLNDTFARLDRKRPVVVYSNDLNNASLVWFALQLMGFDSRQYSWQDWQAHEASSPRVYEIK